MMIIPMIIKQIKNMMQINMIGCLAAMNNNNRLKTSNFKGIKNSNNYIKQALNMYHINQNNRKLDNLLPYDNNSSTHNLSHNKFPIR